MAMRFHKKVLVWGILAGALYFLLSYHIIFIGRHVELLKKSSLTLDCTFFSTQGRKMGEILSIGALRKDGIADLLVRAGKMTPEQRDRLMAQYENKGGTD